MLAFAQRLARMPADQVVVDVSPWKCYCNIDLAVHGDLAETENQEWSCEII